MPANVRYKVKVCTPAILQGQHIVTCTLVGGRRLQHSRVFKTEEAAHDLAARVACKGTVDLAHWVEMMPLPGSRASAALDRSAARERARVAEARESRWAA